MRYFLGAGRDLGHVSASAHKTFAELAASLERPVTLPLTRAEYHALSPKERQLRKRVQYIVPAAFRDATSARKTENVQRCHLLALDIDDAAEAQRLLAQGWDGLGDLDYVVWHTASSQIPQAPRLRVLVSAEAIPPSQYAAAVRTIAEMLGLANVTKESLVPVQPMFWPTTFESDGIDEEASPIVAKQVSGHGEAFLPSDIADSTSEPVEQRVDTDGAPDDLVADITFLRNPVEGITLEDARGALAHLDPDMPMQEWIEVAAGLKHQFGEEGYELWDEWSAKGKKYTDSGETESRWRSLKAQPTDRAPLTIRSVLKKASARGWVNLSLAKRGYAETLAWIRSDTRSTEELIDLGKHKIAQVSALIGTMEKKSLMAALRDKCKSRDIQLTIPDIRKEVRKLEIETAKASAPPPWARGLCFITSQNTFYRYTTDRRFAPEVIDLIYASPSPAGTDEAPMRPRDFLVQVIGVQQVESTRYEPSRQADGKVQRFFTDEGVPFVNTYRPPSLVADPHTSDEAGALLWQHVCNLVLEDEYRRLVVDFLAYHVQHPGKKIRWALLLQGAGGCGKTALAVAMKVVLGSRNTRKVTAANVLDSDFNAWAYGRQLVTMEEVRVVGANRHAVMDKLKPLISDDDISLHVKHKDQETVPNVSNYLMFTNYHDALAVSNNEDRRYFVLASRMQSKEDIRSLCGGEEYFDHLYATIFNKGGGLLHWLQHWSIDPKRFRPEGRAPQTRYLQELAISAASPLSAAVQETIAYQPHALVMKDLLSASVLRDLLETERRLSGFSDQGLSAVLRELGWTKGERVVLNGRKQQLWTAPHFKGDATREAREREECL